MAKSDSVKTVAIYHPYNKQEMDREIGEGIEKNLGGYAQNFTCLLQNQYKDNNNEYSVLVRPAVDTQGDAKNIVHFMDDDFGKNFSKELLEVLKKSKEIYVKILFSFNRNNHWLTGEIKIHKNDHDYAIELTAHDPLGAIKFSKDDIDIIASALQKEIITIDDQAKVDSKSVPSPFKPRLKAKKADAADARAVTDLLARIQGQSLDPAPKKSNDGQKSVPKNVPKIEGLEYRAVQGNGHCLYSVVGLYLGKDQAEVRKIVADYLKQHTKDFSEFIALADKSKTIDEYIQDVEQGKEWADHVEIEALMRALNRPIIVIDPKGKIRNPIDAIRFTGEPVFTYFNDVNHYDAFIPTSANANRGREILSQLLGENAFVQADNNNNKSTDGLKATLSKPFNTLATVLKEKIAALGKDDKATTLYEQLDTIASELKENESKINDDIETKTDVSNQKFEKALKALSQADADYSKKVAELASKHANEIQQLRNERDQEIKKLKQQANTVAEQELSEYVNSALNAKINADEVSSKRQRAIISFVTATILAGITAAKTIAQQATSDPVVTVSLDAAATLAGALAAAAIAYLGVSINRDATNQETTQKQAAAKSNEKSSSNAALIGKFREMLTKTLPTGAVPHNTMADIESGLKTIQKSDANVIRYV